MATRLEDYEFVLGKLMPDGSVGINAGCDTEEKLRDLYWHELLQSDSGQSEFKPHQKLKDGPYIRLFALAFEVEEKFKEQRGRLEGSVN